MTETLQITGLAATPIITALVAAAGTALPALPRRAYPIIAIAVGVTWNVGAAAAIGELTWLAVLYGVVAGLAASGLYSAAVKPAIELRLRIKMRDPATNEAVRAGGRLSCGLGGAEGQS